MSYQYIFGRNGITVKLCDCSLRKYNPKFYWQPISFEDFYSKVLWYTKCMKWSVEGTIWISFLYWIYQQYCWSAHFTEMKCMEQKLHLPSKSHTFFPLKWHDNTILNHIQCTFLRVIISGVTKHINKSSFSFIIIIQQICTQFIRIKINE